MKTNTLYAAALLLFTVGTVSAQQGDKPCQADTEKFCKDVNPGEGRIIACLKEHQAELSADCKIKDLGAGEKSEAKEGGKAGGGNAIGEACKTDFEKFCKDAGHEKMGCMKEHEKDLSEGCKTQLDKARESFMKQHPCAAETQKLCPGLKPGDGKFAACLKEHEKDFSDTCKADFAKRKEEMAKNHPCMADMEKFCKGIKPGDGKLMECMKAHETEFSEGCKAETAKRKDEMQKKNPCAADMEKFCKDVKPGEGRRIACMKAHEAELSDACKARQAEDKDRMGKGGEGSRGWMGRGKPGDKPGDKPEPGAANGSSGLTGALHPAARRRPRLDAAAAPQRKARKD